MTVTAQDYRYSNRTPTLHKKSIILICYTQKYTFLICHAAWHFHIQPKEKSNLNHLQLKQRSLYSYVRIFNLGS